MLLRNYAFACYFQRAWYNVSYTIWVTPTLELHYPMIQFYIIIIIVIVYLQYPLSSVSALNSQSEERGIYKE